MHWALSPDLPTSGIREILNIAIARPGTLRLETGEPDFSPAPHILNAYIEASRSGHNRYTATEGIVTLREALRDKIRRVNRVEWQPENILVTPGGIPGLFLSMMATVSPGDEVLVPDPGWPDYLAGIMSLKGHPVSYPLVGRDFNPDLEELEKRVSRKTRAIVLNFPGNPTGSIPPVPLVEALVQFAQKHDLWIISDEVYDQIIFDGQLLSPAVLDPNRTLSVYSFSKTYAMTGWRLGYMAGPLTAIESLTKVAMGAWSSVSEPLQYAGLAALTQDQHLVETMRQRYLSRRNETVSRLKSWGLISTIPRGAFYVLVDIQASGLDSRTFALELLHEKQVAVAPGRAFGDSADHLVRISLASKEETLREGIDRLATHLGCRPTVPQ